MTPVACLTCESVLERSRYIFNFLSRHGLSSINRHSASPLVSCPCLAPSNRIACTLFLSGRSRGKRYNLHGIIKVYVSIRQVLAHLHEKRLYSLRAHVQEVGKQLDAHPVDALEDVLHLHRPELLLVITLRPWVSRNGEDFFVYCVRTFEN